MEEKSIDQWCMDEGDEKLGPVLFQHTTRERLATKHIDIVSDNDFREHNYVNSALCTLKVSCYGVCAHYVIVCKIQWKPFWLATQLYHRMTRLDGNFV